MFRNFITDTDLKSFHPKLTTQLWAGITNYQTLIAEAFDRVNDDLHTMQIDSRRIMTPLDLKRPASSGNSVSGHILLVTGTADTTSTTGISCSAAVPNYRRFVVNALSVTGTWTFQLQGSNDQVGWENVPGASASVTAMGEQSVLYTNEYGFYRYLNTLVSTGATDTVSYNASLLETIFDRLITYKALTMIFRDFRRVQGDQSDTLMKDYEKAYDHLVQHLRYSYDANDSGTIDATEEVAFTNAYFQR